MSKRPWNLVNSPVYAVSSHDGNGKHNMHIITYATPISMQPKRYICGIYEGTQSLDNIHQYPHFVLQVLANHQYNLINLLGKQSGKNIDKIARLAKRKLITAWNGFYILNECIAVIQLHAIQQMSGGDHEAFLCDVSAYKTLNEGIPLDVNTLREHRLIRI